MKNKWGKKKQQRYKLWSHGLLFSSDVILKLGIELHNVNNVAQEETKEDTRCGPLPGLLLSDFSSLNNTIIHQFETPEYSLYRAPG